MKQKLKLSELVNKSKSIVELLDCKMKIDKTKEFVKFKMDTRKHIESFYKERDKLLTSMAEPDKEKDGKYNFKDDKQIKEFNDKIAEMLNKEISITIPKISEAEFHGELSPNTYEQLAGFIITE
jgi:deoxyribodipyrimidine photolyase-like uncharacterized protein